MKNCRADIVRCYRLDLNTTAHISGLGAEKGNALTGAKNSLLRNF